MYKRIGPDPHKKRYTFGFLDENIDNDFHNLILEGISEAARELDIDVIRFSYYSSHIAYKFSHQVDMVLDHIQQYDLDGLLFLGWTQAGAMYNHEDFMRRFGSMPLLSLGTIFDDIPSVYFTGDEFIAKMTRHLIEVHNLTRIAYVEHYRADNRRDAYERVMREYGIYDPRLYVGNDVLPSGMDQHQERSRRAAQVLMDERKLDVQAVISPNYNETGFLIDEFQSRGFSVPADIAVVSYEEGDFAEYSYPGYTTVYFPWRELGYVGCVKLEKLVREGSIPMETELSDYGRIIYRESCGCLPYYVRPADAERTGDSVHGVDGMTALEKCNIVNSLYSLYEGCGISFEKLVDAFIIAFICRDGMTFLKEAEEQLRNIKAHSKINELATDIRNLIYPFLLTDINGMLWSGNLFMQFQALVSEKTACMHGVEVLRARMMDQSLQNLDQRLFLNFSLHHLITVLEDGLKMLEINSCHIFISNSIFTGTDVEENLFDNSVLLFKYVNGKRIETSQMAGSLKQQLAMIRSEGIGQVSLAYLLHVTDEIMGFVLFGPGAGPLDEIFYQTLSTNISTSLHGIVLLNRLDQAYRKLVEHAQKEGMADIAANILHSIGNTLNSMNVSLHLVEESSGAQLFSDIIMAGGLLGENMMRLEEFISSDVRGKKLMQFYLKLGNAAERLQLQLIQNMYRLKSKIAAINDAVAAQQSYAGIDVRLEELLLEPIIEDALKLNKDTFDRQSITVAREYEPGFRALVHRAKLFFIIFNIISNARDAMSSYPANNKTISIKTYTDNSGKYLRISDNGRGIPEGSLDRIFEYGFSTKEGRSGYGLYSCSRYMEDMGGTIHAESDGKEKGASFVLKFS
ncbi:MAG: substrate-binding domain-containing protein [Clostridiaceae bacterium]|nr:substrate-binding domain-containing protein [Clostridiaceae bacterium]